MSRSTRKWRLNVRAAIILGAILGVVLPSLAVLSYYRGLSSPKALLRQAEGQLAADPPQYDLALGYLNEYLKAVEPADPEAFEALARKSEVLDRAARSAADLDEAVRVCQLALNPNGAARGRDPADPQLQEVRRRLVLAYLKMVPFRGAEAPLSTAEDVARELVALSETARADRLAEDLRLLARVLEYGAARGANEAARAEALAVMERAFRADPTDLATAEELAAMYQVRAPAGNPEARAELAAKADQVLDELLRRNEAAAAAAEGPEARDEALGQVVAARLVRFRRLAARAAEEPDPDRRAAPAARAAEELARALEAQPENVDVLLAAAEYAAQNGDIEGARRHYDQVPAEVRDSLRGQLVRGLIDLGRDRPDAAVEAWRRGLEAAGGADADLTWQLAYILIDLGRLDEAEPLLRQHRRLLGAEEPTPRHSYLEGLYRLKAGRLDEALDALQKARFGADDRFRAQVLLAIAQAYALRGEPDEALTHYAEAAKARPGWSVPHLGRVAVLQQAGRLDEALEALDLALLELPRDPELLVAKARALMILEQRQPAAERDWGPVEAQLNAARAVAPRSATLVRAEADLKAVQGDLNGAADVLSQAVRHDPGDAELWVAWAAVLARMGQPQQALMVLQQAAAPDAAGDAAVLRIARARIQVATGDGQQARETLTRDIDGLPRIDQARLWAELGQQLRQRGQLDAARDAYRRWVALQPEDPKPRVALMELANTLGDRQAARAEIEALEALGGVGKIYATAARAQELLRAGPDGATPPAEDLAEADRLITELEAAPTSQRAAALLRGLYHERRDEPEAAIAAYSRAFDAGAGQAAATRLIVLYTRTGQLDELEALRERMTGGDLAAEAAGDGPGIGTGFDRLSTLALLREGRTDEAVALARQGVAADPTGLDARLWLARVLNTAGQPAEAEATLRELAEASTEPGPWLTLLLFQAQRGETEQARATVEQIKQRVQSAQPEMLLGQCYRILGDDAAAEQAFQAARAKNPDDAAAARALAGLYEATDRPEEAIALLRDVLQRDEKARWAARALALLRSKQPDGWDEAWALAQLPEGSRDTPEERLARALVLSRSPNADRRDQAVAQLEDLAADLPATNATARAAREALARTYLARGQNDKLASLTALGASSGSNPQAIAIHAEVLIRNGQVAEARRQLERLELAAPGDIVTAKLRALVLKAEGQLGEAAAALEEAFAAHRDDADGGRAAGREFLAMLGATSADAGDRPPSIPGQDEVAERLAREVADAWPADAWMLGRILARQGRTDAALEACRTAAWADAAEPRDAREAAALAVSLAVAPNATQATRDAADAVVQRARDLDPEAPDTIILQAFLRHAQGRYEEEVELYRQARARRAPSALYLNNMAWTLALELGQPEEALEVIDGLMATIRTDPRLSASRVQCLDTRGMVLVALGRHDEAIRDFEAAIKADPDNPVYQYHLARAYRKAGREDQFRTHLERARQAGLKPELLEPSERDEMQQLLAH